MEGYPKGEEEGEQEPTEEETKDWLNWDPSSLSDVDWPNRAWANFLPKMMPKLGAKPENLF